MFDDMYDLCCLYCCTQQPQSCEVLNRIQLLNPPYQRFGVHYNVLMCNDDVLFLFFVFCFFWVHNDVFYDVFRVYIYIYVYMAKLSFDGRHL